ncbi:hypothetical protein Tco_1528260, partial [Tanacetum coccineum]
PPNKRYDLMDANKKVDLEHVQCPPESKILTNIIKNHPLRFSIAASSSVPWIYMAQFWHTLKEDTSKYRIKFMLDKKELTLTLDDFRTIFHLPQATDNNHNSFMPPPLFSDMVPFYKQELGFTIELKTSSSFKTTGLLQPWQTLLPTIDKADEMILQDTLQVSLAKHKVVRSRKQEKMWHWLMSTWHPEEIEKMVDGQENVVDDNSIPRNDESNIPSTRIEPRSNKESSEVEITKDKEVEITKDKEVEITKVTPVVDIINAVIPVNVNDEDVEIIDEVYELKRMEKGKIVEETRNSTIPTPIRSPRIHTNLVSSDTEKLQELTNTHTTSSSRQNLLASNATRASFRSYKDVM